ncbi:PREDICTED: poly [ADP-ribose] polymerase 6 [Tinamus guttatus]|uniref:poly [ADP-ribose] polymerase 6 n=1 Tax=Tinamus guttatus TaxID=94827 RepID=UPI00052F18D1|nr:PREDICTED: poly [ADP-ribose] polymerase 6 [Tinamus guttatus]
MYKAEAFLKILKEEVATAWKVLRAEPIVLRLRFSLSQYLDGPEPSIEVFQPSNKEGFGLGLKLKKILGMFTSQQWKHLSNDFLKSQQEKRHSWFKTSGTIKKFRAGLSIFSPIPKSPSFPVIQDSVLKGKLGMPEVRVNRSCFGHLTLGQSRPRSSPRVVDLLVAMCRAALESPRKSIIFEPYPSVVDPNDPKTLAFNPKKKNYERLQKALDSVMSIREMTQGSYLEIKKQMDKLDPLAHPLLQWIISSNRSHIVKLPLSRQLKFMHTSHQFLLLSSPPAKEARFRTAKKLYGSTFAFQCRLSHRDGEGTAPDAFEGRAGAEVQPDEHHPAVITSKDLQKHGNIWVCPVSDHVCTRFFFVYEDGQVGDANINTQDPKIQKEIMRVIGTQVYTN